MKVNILPPQESAYADLLTEVDKSIKSLYYTGKLPENRQPSVAIIGTRKPSNYGKEVAYSLAYELAKQGIVIISGLAYGIDAIAHRAALDAGGITIAVLPTGLKDIYPVSHRTLALRIIESGGALVTEYSPGTIAYKANFIARNRIVSGLSDGVLIIEAAQRSGTIATAGFALEQGRPVMAVPGPITSPMSVGCNNLIKTGARPVTSTEEVLQEIGATSQVAKQLPMAYTPDEQVLIQLLAAGLRDGDELQKRSGLEPAAFNQTLTMLEISGRVRALGANQWVIC